MIDVLLGKFFSLLPDWLSLLILLVLSLLALALAAVLAARLVQAVLRIRWRSQTARRFIRICNESNVTGKFLLRVDGPQEALKFQCLLDGNTLPNAPVVPKASPSQPGQAAPPAPASSVAGPSVAAPAAASPSLGADGAKKELKKSAEKAKEESKKGLGFLRLFAGIFATLGGLLPGSVGASLKEKSTQLQSAAQDAGAKMQLPEQKLKAVEHLKGQAGQLNPGAKKGEKGVPGPAGVSQAAPERSAAPETGVKPAHPAVGGAAQTQEEQASGFLQTPPLSPGESLCIELQIDPIRRYRSGEYSFAVLVHQLALAEMPPQHPPAASTSRGRVKMRGLSPIYWILSFLMALCVVVLNGAWAVVFVSWLARFVQ